MAGKTRIELSRLRLALLGGLGPGDGLSVRRRMDALDFLVWQVGLESVTRGVDVFYVEGKVPRPPAWVVEVASGRGEVTRKRQAPS